MAIRTDYAALVKRGLEGLYQESEGLSSVDPMLVGAVLERVSEQLRNRDGWCDYRQIWQAVYEAAMDTISRRRKGPESNWYSIRNAVDTWYSHKGIGA